MRARFEKLDKRYQAKKARFDIVNTRHGGLKAACTDRHDRWIGFREKASKKTASPKKRKAAKKKEAPKKRKASRKRR